MAAEPPRTTDQAAPRRMRSFWLKHPHRWHWVSAALCLVGMLLCAATGITLNHAADIGATPVVSTSSAVLPDALRPLLSEPTDESRQVLPDPVQDWVVREFAISGAHRAAEWSAADISLALPRPGGDGWLSIDRETGEATVEVTTRGWIAYLDDLHKGRDTGLAWRWFIDVFAAACLLFCATGLLRLHLHAGGRPATWPVPGLGLVVPLILGSLFIH
ncbi:PepSY-associated TM helix domain-containing protein [Falsiroseomonas sp. E2-1-a20]|uniref:PepSY-associated TM helix domain-containing protein n=1 Tax=Falsiroseomonas sp. E2-1-a20 TaxID=3239300 RepID=UPI003F40712D